MSRSLVRHRPLVALVRLRDDGVREPARRRVVGEVVEDRAPAAGLVTRHPRTTGGDDGPGTHARPEHPLDEPGRLVGVGQHPEARQPRVLVLGVQMDPKVGKEDLVARLTEPGAGRHGRVGTRRWVELTREHDLDRVSPLTQGLFSLVGAGCDDRPAANQPARVLGAQLVSPALEEPEPPVAKLGDVRAQRGVEAARHHARGQPVGQLGERREGVDGLVAAATFAAMLDRHLLAHCVGRRGWDRAGPSPWLDELVAPRVRVLVDPGRRGACHAPAACPSGPLA